MNVQLEFITPNAVEQIGRYAGICYNSSLEKEACIKRAVSCKERGHLATLRFATATFRIGDISRACSHQFVRSKHLDFLQRSQRYCTERDTSCVVPSLAYSDHDPQELAKIYDEHYQACISKYNKLLDMGVRKEDARFVLPEAATTELIVTGNFQAWVDFIKLRADKHAQWEIREVAKTINNILAKETDNTIFTWMP